MKWDAEAYHRAYRKKHAPQRERKRLIVATLVLGVLGASLAATAFVGGQQVGICHATGSQERPYVLLVVADDGYEHGHHRHHANDYFVDAGTTCDGRPAEAIVPPPADGPDTQDAGAPGLPDDQDNGTEAGGAAPTDGSGAGPPGQENGTQGAGPDDAEDGADEAADAGDGTDDSPGTNGTDADATDDETAGDQDADDPSAPEGNSTGGEAPENGSVADVRVVQRAAQDEFEVVLSLRVVSAGDAAATDVALMDDLPDLRRTWYLGGADADACVLDGRFLTCWFGTMGPGDSRSVFVQAYTDRMPCGFSLTNTASIVSGNDSDSRNDASSASIQARAC